MADESPPRVSVILPTHNPNLPRWRRTLEALAAQSLPYRAWELLVVDNASSDRSALEQVELGWHPLARTVHEPELGLTPARLRGFGTARADVFVLVDDDNVLAPNYLTHVAARFAGDPALGAAGGKSVPDFESPPPPWAREFDGLLALRDLGDTPQCETWTRGTERLYPRCAPIGAGMALRRAGAAAYAAALANDRGRRSFDRTGAQLVSGGDNDLVMTILETGASVGYFPELELTHLIPKSRSHRGYLGALNRAIGRSWVRVLALHGIRPWSAVSPLTLRLRQLRAWVRTSAWRGPAEWVRWQGQCGHFEGRADLSVHVS